MCLLGRIPYLRKKVITSSSALGRSEIMHAWLSALFIPEITLSILIKSGLGHSLTVTGQTFVLVYICKT
jgi:hypothetical protein